jgi:hypothetical protein
MMSSQAAPASSRLPKKISAARLAQKQETGAVHMGRLFALFAALSLTTLQFAATVA